MADPQTIEGLLEGAFDTHVHTAPDVLPRRLDDLELAQRFRTRRMGGFVLKSHYICTADRATLVRRVVPEVQAFGAIALNNAVGGLNPLALDIAGRLGARVAWLPSVDNANELESVAGQRDESKMPYWMSIAREMRGLGIAGSWLNVTQDGRVTPATRQCLEIIAKHDMVLATSHIRPSEMLPVVQAASEVGVQRIVITHPEFPTTLLSVEQQRELATYGAYFERCFTTPHSGKIDWDQVYRNIREVGPASTIVATDLGQVNNPYPDEGLGQFISNLLDNGFSEAEVGRMVHDNPAELLGAAVGAVARSG
ncbi:MAG TPA: DUF6282 family protein [Chloroflexota bacterium]|jgi:hypothetical protein|nr:DUF6282 family protein [Chloroflexota bacterium]